MKLSVGERVALLDVLSTTRADLTMLRIVRDLQTDLSFSEEEAKHIELTEDETGTRWKAEKDAGKEVEIGPKATDLVVRRFQELSEQERLTVSHLSAYERFVPKEEDSE